MNLFNEMKTAKNRVEYLLQRTPRLRDDDNKLIANYHFNEIGAENVAKLNAMEFLKLYASGKLTSSESIRRVRAKLQEQKPELRGEKYNRRQQDGDDFTNNIGEL